MLIGETTEEHKVHWFKFFPRRVLMDPSSPGQWVISCGASYALLGQIAVSS